MKRAANAIFAVYAVIVLADLLLLLLRRDDLRWFSKPLLMPALLLSFFLLHPPVRGKLFYLILSALLLSGCGDVFLLAKNLFIPGLVSFLLAHVAFILYFHQAETAERGFLRRQPLVALPVLLYIFLLMVVLFPHLGALKVPVIVYSLTIGTMLLMAINTRKQLAPVTSGYFIAGALFFVLSDSLLAVNLFMVKNRLLAPFVMATYATAQYLIVKGALANAKRRRAVRLQRTTVEEQGSA